MADCNKTEVFFAEWERMCRRFSCENRPLAEIIEGKTCSFWAKRKPEDIIKGIQAWSDSNPIKTRQSELLKLFPETYLVNGVINICPKDISRSIICVNPEISCDDCKKQYWLTEVE